MTMTSITTNIIHRTGSSFVDSGNEMSLTHSWSINGTYQIRAMAKDQKRGVSD